MELANQTPFSAQMILTSDAEGAEVLAVVVKACFDIERGGELSVADEQEPVVLADTFHGEPGKSSLLEASDLCLLKPGTDLILRGSAWTRRDETCVDVKFQIGHQSKQLKVFGPRVWEKRFGRFRISEPEPFESVPLIWENAFGGWDTSADDVAHHECEPNNPVGTGFRAKHSKVQVEGTPLPKIENPAQLMRKPDDRPSPVGLGFIGRDWQPRLGFAGTYDDAWQKDRMPLLPTDFDPRYYDRAPQDMIADKPPAAGDPIVVQGTDPSGEIRLRTPAIDVGARIFFNKGTADVQLHFDTILVDADRSRLQVTYSGHERVHGRVRELSLVHVEGGR